MAQYEVTGVLTPDVTTVDTGPSAGVHNNADYWVWNVGGTDWYLYRIGPNNTDVWCIFTGLTVGIPPIVFGWGYWLGEGPGIEGSYNPNGAVAGVATVALLVDESSSSSQSSLSSVSSSQSSQSSQSSSSQSSSSISTSSSTGIVEHPDTKTVTIVGSFQMEITIPTS